MIDTLIEKIKKTNAPICVGLDPKPEMIPQNITDACFEEFGVTQKAMAQAFLKFNEKIIDAVKDIVPSVKPQIAMYEELGAPGLEAYISTVQYAKKSGLIVVGDVKRGDIGSTSLAYANAHIGAATFKNNDKTFKFSAFDADFATLNPYMGSDGINEFIKCCREYDRGIFILVKTSNPSGAEIQDLKTSDGDTVYEKVAKLVNEWGDTLKESSGYSKVGAVIGATYPEVGKKLRDLMPAAFFLVPGYGAQGAVGKDLKEYFNKDGLGALINSSRGIIAAYKNEKYKNFGMENFADAARQSTLDMIKDLRENAIT